MNQTNSQCAMKLVFTQEQIEEQVNFTQYLEQGNVETAFKGSFLEGKAFLEGTSELVESSIH